MSPTLRCADYVTSSPKASGDAFGRIQHGNNNAYAPDNPAFWIDWEGCDHALEDHVAALSRLRAERSTWSERFPEPGVWRKTHSGLRTAQDWESAATDGVIYEPTAASGTLEISRLGRKVGWTAPR